MDYSYYGDMLDELSRTQLRDYPSELDKVIDDTARSGIVRYSWALLKPLVRVRLQTVLDHGFQGQECREDEQLCDNLLDRLDQFSKPPFTIQRVCELISQPTKHYRRIGPYIRAVERNLLVVSTQEPDLTWMKSPRLTQLLEEPVNSDKKSCDQQPQSCDMAPDSPTEMSNGSEQNGVDVRVGRKRKACDNELASQDRGTVLQEADSTTPAETEILLTQHISEESPAKRLKQDAASNGNSELVTSGHAKTPDESTGQAETS